MGAEDAGEGSPASRSIPVTVIIAARDEEDEVGACIRSVSWAREVLVVENDSRDATAERAREAGATVFSHPFVTIGAQRNAAIARASEPWILVLDADERATPAFGRALAALVASPPAATGDAAQAYRVRRRNFFFGREIRHGGWERDRPVRVFPATLRYDERPVHEHVIVSGTVRDLAEPLLHTPYASLDEYFEKLQRYSRGWAEQHFARGRRASIVDLLVRPWGRVASMLVLRSGWRDGVHGVVLAVLAGVSVAAKYAQLWALGRLGAPPNDTITRMRHLFVTQDYAPDLGGMARRHVELCRRFAPDHVTVSTVAAPGAEHFDRGESYELARQPFPFAGAKRFANQVAWGSDIARRCRAGVDVVHLGNIRPCGYAVQLATRRVRVPYLVYVYGGDLLREQEKTARSSIKRWSGRDIFARAAGVVAISQWSAALARDVMAQVGVRRPPPVAAIDLGTDPVQFDPSRATGALRQRLGIGDAPLALTVARLVPHKGQDTAIRAIHALGDDGRDVHLVLVGGGADAPRLQEIAESLGMAHRVHLTGALSDGEIAEAYASADVYLGLSRVDQAINAEGFGLSFVEAAASGTPSIAGDSGGVRSAVRDGETGFVVPPTDVDAVAAALRRLVVDPELRHSMGAAARRAVESHYNWDRVARETLDFTRTCIAAARAV